MFLVTERGKLPPAIFKLPPPVPARKNLIKSFQCNFDVNVCGMKQDKTDKENYILHRGKTKNSNTGPSRDSTSRRGKILQPCDVVVSSIFILFQESTFTLMVMPSVQTML